jgi:hypothetical protein
MPGPTVFISYHHGDPSTDIANTVYIALSAVAPGMGFEIFMDRQAVEPADLFDKVILDGLNRTTHFLALIDNDYWASAYCRKELAHAVTRYERGEPVRVLFVMAGPIKPEYMTLEPDRAAGRIPSDPLIHRIGDLQFLGPFDKGRHLERLKYEDRAALRDQIKDLIDEIERVMPPPVL